jgi:glycosyltransferase involved in cell wall biosynthesis
VVINCFNGAEFLLECLKSIRSQDFQDFEVIFWDNRSTDDSAKIFQSTVDERFKYFLASQHTTLYAARNKAMEECSGEFIAFLDCDDIWLPDKLSKQIKAFEEKSIGYSCTQYVVSNQRRGTRETTISRLPEGDITRELLRENFIHMSSLMVRKIVIDGLAKKFDDRYTVIGDFDFNVRLSLVTNLKIIQEPLTIYRWHGNNTGLKSGFAYAKEFECWFADMDHISLLANDENYEALKKKNLTNSMLMLLYRNEKRRALRFFWDISLALKLKLLIAVILPISLIKCYLDSR